MQVNDVADNGLVIGHSYSVTGVTEVNWGAANEHVFFYHN